MKRSLIVAEQGVQLDHRDGRFEVLREGSALQRVREHELAEIILLGEVTVTPRATFAALQARVDIAYLTARGTYRGRLSSGGGRRADLVLAQFRAVTVPEERQRVARAIVAGKLANQRRLLLRYRDLKRAPGGLAASLSGIRRMAERTVEATTLDELRGMEGRAAVLYWREFGRALQGTKFRFSGRNFRPPTDPVNACLSFAYTMLATTCESAVRLVGFEPGLGFLHDASPGRASLALDVMEEFRPAIVDRLVLRLLRLNQLGPTDFEVPDLERRIAEIEDSSSDAALTAPGVAAAPATSPAAPPAPATPLATPPRPPKIPVYLGSTGRKILLRALYRRMRDRVLYEPSGGEQELRAIIELQVRHLARVVLGQDPEYRAFALR